ncbi:MAG: adenylate kinase [Sulfurospirillum sp.]|nr:adenylate kinase [Sulfurospirillum sp.]MBL0702376.1 adenylate kinase [Sulfurospirillum sp.]
MKSLFLIIGAPGSGKTTNAQTIAKENKNIGHYSTGELLRTEVASGSKLGKVIDKCISVGELVPIQVALDTIIKAINNSTCNTILIDGYPRSNEQMMGLDTVLKNEKTITLKSVMEVVVSEQTAMNRVLGRNRGKDDNVEIFKNRMKVYTQPLKDIQDFYNSKNLLFKISGEGSIETIVDEMTKYIALHKN